MMSLWDIVFVRFTRLLISGLQVRVLPGSPAKSPIKHRRFRVSADQVVRPQKPAVLPGCYLRTLDLRSEGCPAQFVWRGSSQQLNALCWVLFGEPHLRTDGRQNHGLHKRPLRRLLGEIVGEWISSQTRCCGQCWQGSPYRAQFVCRQLPAKITNYL